ncbi:thiamine diphosphokinase [Malassezia pachydermatis]
MMLWDLSHSLRVSGEETYDLVLLNTPIPEEHAAIFQLLWNHARYRIAADGGANRLFQFMQTHEEELKLPSLICGDLDSIKSHVRASFEAKGVDVQRFPSQYSTDLQKAIQALEEREGSRPLELIIFGGLTGRLDQSAHTLHVLWQLSPGTLIDGMVVPPAEGDECKDGRVRRRARTLVVSDGCITCLLDAGSHTLQHDRRVLGKSCGILPLGVATAHVHTTGLEWNLHGETSTLGGFLSTSNHLAHDNGDGVVTITTDVPVYWTVELQTDDVLDTAWLHGHKHRA